jgi:hypothetical protein
VCVAPLMLQVAVLAAHISTALLSLLLMRQASYALGYNLAIEYLADYEKTWMLDSFRDLNARVLNKDIDWIFLEVRS